MSSNPSRCIGCPTDQDERHAPRRRTDPCLSIKVCRAGSCAVSVPAVRTDRERLEARNRCRLQRFHSCENPQLRLKLRNALVADNLPLVFALAGRWNTGFDLPFEDLAQVGSIGLIKAVEAFDASRSTNLSSFAVPYIRGAIQHECRDRRHLMRIPRLQWELRQRIAHLQEQRRAQGLPSLGEEGLACTIGCDRDQVADTLALSNVTTMQSLDAPLVTGGGEGKESGCLLDQLSDPVSTGQAGIEEPAEQPAATAEQLWLRRQMRSLDPVQQQLLEGRLRLGCTWVELGRQLGMPPRQAQRRCDAVLDQLQRAAGAWRTEQAQNGIRA